MNIKSIGSGLLQSINPWAWLLCLVLAGVAFVTVIGQWFVNLEYIWLFWNPLMIAAASFNCGQLLKEKRTRLNWALLAGNILVAFCVFTFAYVLKQEGNTGFWPWHFSVLLTALSFFGRAWQIWTHKI